MTVLVDIDCSSSGGCHNINSGSGVDNDISLLFVKLCMLDMWLCSGQSREGDNEKAGLHLDGS